MGQDSLVEGMNPVGISYNIYPIPNRRNCRIKSYRMSVDGVSGGRDGRDTYATPDRGVLGVSAVRGDDRIYTVDYTRYIYVRADATRAVGILGSLRTNPPPEAKPR
jgi:hypothetical protein